MTNKFTIFLAACITTFFLMNATTYADQGNTGWGDSDSQSNNQDSRRGHWRHRKLKANANISAAPKSGFGSAADTTFDGISTVTRLEDGMVYSINARGFAPGEAHTMWFTATNNPRACATPCECSDAVDGANPDVGLTSFWAGGRVADQSGALDIKGYADYSGDNGTPLFGSGEVSKNAEIRLFLRKHGVASTDPATLDFQLSDYIGGCDTNICEDYVVATHVGAACL